MICINENCNNEVREDLAQMCGTCYMHEYREKKRKKKAFSLIREAYGLEGPLSKHYVIEQGKKVLDIEYYRNKYNIEVGL